MFNKFKKFSLLGLAALPAVALTSCSTQSQFYPSIYIKGIDGFENYRIAYGTDNSIYEKSGDSYTKISTSSSYMKDYLKFYLAGVVPFLSLAQSLVNVAHYPEVRESGSDDVYTNNLVFGDTSSLSTFKEFVYASANILNQGKSKQLKLGISEVNIKNTDANNTTTTIDFKESLAPKNNDVVNIDKVEEDKQLTVSNGKVIYYLDDTGAEQKLTKDQKFSYVSTDTNNTSKSSYGYSSKVSSISMDVTFKYFDPANKNVNKEPKTYEEVKSYVESNNAWNDVEVTKDSFTISFNLKVNLRPKFTLKTFIEKNENETLTDDEKNQLIKISGYGNDTATTTITDWSYGTDNKDENKSLFKNWSYDTQFKSYNITPIDTDTYLKELDNTTGTKLDDFSNTDKLNDYLKNISSPPKMNNADKNYKAFTDEIKKFQHFITYIN